MQNHEIQVKIKYTSCTINPNNRRFNNQTKSKKELPRKSDIVYNSQNVLQAWYKYTHQCSQLDISSLHEKYKSKDKDKHKHNQKQKQNYKICNNMDFLNLIK